MPLQHMERSTEEQAFTQKPMEATRLEQVDIPLKEPCGESKLEQGKSMRRKEGVEKKC